MDIRRPLNILAESSHNFFWAKYNRIFSNILVLFNLIDSDKATMNQFTLRLLRFLQMEDVIKKTNLVSVRTFLWNVHEDLSLEIKQELVDLMLSTEKYHNQDSFELIGGLLQSLGAEGISHSHFAKILELHFNSDNGSKRKHSPSTIVYFFKSASHDQQVIIKDMILESLMNKFDRDLYYRSVMYDLIEYSHELFDLFYEGSIPKSNATSFRNAFINKNEKRFEFINEVINLCFKFELDLSAKRFDSIRDIDPYYRWLLALDNFDYSEFKPYWIAEYNTSYYNERFRNCQKLRATLSSFLRTNRNPTIQQTYFNIYGY